MYDLIVRNGKLVTPDRIYEADIVIQDGVYAGFLAKDSGVEAKEVIDAKGNYVFPGIVDCHAHLNEPSLMNSEIFDIKLGKISKRSAVDYDNQPGSVKNNLNDLVDRCGIQILNR